MTQPRKAPRETLIMDATCLLRERDAVHRAVAGVLFNVLNFPERAQVRLLGQDMGPLNDKITGAVLDALRHAAVPEPSAEGGHDGWCGCEKCEPDFRSITYNGRTESFGRGELGYVLLGMVERVTAAQGEPSDAALDAAFTAFRAHERGEEFNEFGEHVCSECGYAYSWPSGTEGRQEVPPRRRQRHIARAALRAAAVTEQEEGKES